MFSPQTRRYFETARGFGKLAAPSHQSRIGHGPYYFQLHLQLDGEGIVRELAFDCPRCVPAIACGGYLFERLVGHRCPPFVSLEELVHSLGGLPAARSFYAFMAVEALRQAISGQSS